MKKIEQAGASAKTAPGMTSYTGNSVLNRTAKNTPANEDQIRGVAYLPREKLVLLRAIRSEEDIQDGIRRGVLVVI